MLEGKMLKGGAFIVVTLLATAIPAKGEKPRFVIKWGTIAPERSLWGDMVHQAMQEIKEKTNGDVKNVWYFGAVMGDEPDLVRKVRLNQLQGIAVLSVGLTKISPEMMVFSLPLLFQNYKEVDCVMDKMWGTIEKLLGKKGFVPLGRADVGFSVFFSKTNIKEFQDFSRVKFWMWSGVEAINIVADFYGIKNRVPLMLTDVLTGLQTGLVDTVFATYYTSIALQWYNEVTYMSDVNRTGGAYAPAFLLLRKNVWEKFPPEYKKTFQEVCNKLFPKLRRQLRKDEEKAKKALLDMGLKIMDTSPSFIQEIKSKLGELYQKMVGKYYPKWLLDETISARDQCRSEQSEQ